MEMNLQSLDSVVEPLQDLLSEEIAPLGGVDGHELRASHPVIALELVAWVLQAETGSYPTTPEESKVFRKSTKASIRASWLTPDPVELSKAMVHGFG